MEDKIEMKKTRLALIMSIICMALPPDTISSYELSAIGRVLTEAPKGIEAKGAGEDGGPLDLLFAREAKRVIEEESAAREAALAGAK